MGLRVDGTSQLTRQVRRDFRRRTGSDLVKVCGRCGLPTVDRNAPKRYLAFRYWRAARGPIRRAAFQCLLAGHVWRYV